MTIASRLKLNIWLSMAVVFMLMTALGAAIIIENDIRERSLFADQLMRGVFELSLITDYYIRHPEERPKTQWQHKQASLLQLLQERRYQQAEKVRLELINQSLSDLGALFDKLTETYVSGRPDETIARQKREQLADLIIMRSRAIAETTAQMATESRAAMAAVIRRIAVAFPVLSLLVLAITVWSATRIRQSIAGPIEQLRQGAALIGTGHLDYRIGLASADEFGQLAGEFDQMAQRLQTITASRDELSQEVAERQRAEAALTKRTEELARSNKDLEQFAYVASHDLQEPLRAVAGCVQLLQKRYQGQLDERADEFIAHAVEGTQRMRQLIDDLLAFSRVSTRGEPLQPMDSGVALAAALANLTVAVHESGAVITHDPLPTVTADPTQLTLLLQNLISNAIKFRREGSPHIHVGAQRQGYHWVLSVRDNGIGIEPQYFERIFGIFQRLHTRSEYAGTGMGLAICKKIVERHGGHLWVESVPGAGCTFYGSLPDGQ